jgi:hypothetical protein
MRTLRRRLGIEGRDFDATLQALRHWTHFTLSEAGYNAKQVASRGGHSETLMNRVYVHRTRGADQAMTDFIGEILTGTDSNDPRPGRGEQKPR